MSGSVEMSVCLVIRQIWVDARVVDVGGAMKHFALIQYALVNLILGGLGVFSFPFLALSALPHPSIGHRSMGRKTSLRVYDL